MGEWREQEEKQLAEIKKSISLVNTQLREIQSRKVEVYSLDQQEIELAKQTANPSLNLSFFEIDEEVFDEKLTWTNCTRYGGKLAENWEILKYIKHR